MATDDAREAERVGSVLHDKWTLERLIGAGGMGAVYAARHRNGARAAVKVLSTEAARQPHIKKRFLHEGYAANRVNHPGAVKVLDDDVVSEGPDAGTAYLVMELLEGESLAERARRDPPLDERDLLDIADRVLSVLEAAHANGVVHRDLKPDNLFLVGDGARIKVLDFGLARLVEAQEKTIAGMALGTALYMSPEQAAGRVDEIDGRTDIYALGSILFQLVSHRRIHDAAHTLGLVVQMATTPAPKLRTIVPDVSEAFSNIVDRALEFRREDRYATAAEMRADVRAALEGLDGLGHHATPPPSGGAPDERPPSRLRAIAPGALAVALAASCAVLALRSWPSTRPVFARSPVASTTPEPASTAHPAFAADAADVPAVVPSPRPTAIVERDAGALDARDSDASAMDASAADASAVDASAVDASAADATDDDDDDDEVDAGAASSAPTAPVTAPRRIERAPAPATSPVRPKRPRRPGHAPARKRRWHP